MWPLRQGASVTGGTYEKDTEEGRDRRMGGTGETSPLGQDPAVPQQVTGAWSDHPPQDLCSCHCLLRVERVTSPEQSRRALPPGSVTYMVVLARMLTPGADHHGHVLRGMESRI